MTDENGMKTITVEIDGMHCEKCVESIGQAFSRIEGIGYYDIGIGHARVSFLPQLVSMMDIENAIDSSGYTIRAPERRTGRWGRFIEKMIRSNEKTFGTGKLDCCSIISDQEKRDKLKKTI